MSRVSQKQVEEVFVDECRYSGVPLKSDRNSKIKCRRGSFQMGYAYGKMGVEYVYPQSTIINDVSGYLSARDMMNWKMPEMCGCKLW